MAGIAIKDRAPDERGTLTGLATRVVSGKVQKMLVTCQHATIYPHVGFDLGLTSRERVYYYAL